MINIWAPSQICHETQSESVGCWFNCSFFQGKPVYANYGRDEDFSIFANQTVGSVILVRAGKITFAEKVSPLLHLRICGGAYYYRGRTRVSVHYGELLAAFCRAAHQDTTRVPRRMDLYGGNNDYGTKMTLLPSKRWDSSSALRLRASRLYRSSVR